MGSKCSTRAYSEFFPHPYRGGVGVVKFRDGSVYYGSIKNGHAKHGMARLEFSNGSVYLGYYANDKRNGIGHFIFADGASYKGFWKNGRVTYSGHALFTSACGYEIYINWCEEEDSLKGLCVKMMMLSGAEMREDCFGASCLVPCVPCPSSSSTACGKK